MARGPQFSRRERAQARTPIVEAPRAPQATEREPARDAVAGLQDRVGNALLTGSFSGEDVGPLAGVVHQAAAMGLAGMDASAVTPGTAPLSLMRAMLSAFREEEAAGGPPPSLERALGTGGQPLPAAVRERMERAFGHAFGHVRVHADGAAARAAEDLNAHAFAVGPDVWFGQGEWRPDTRVGAEVLAHELTHVVQHDEGRLPGAAGPGMRVSSPSDSHEREAVETARQVVAELGTMDAGGLDGARGIGGALGDGALDGGAIQGGVGAASVEAVAPGADEEEAAGAHDGTQTGAAVVSRQDRNGRTTGTPPGAPTSTPNNATPAPTNATSDTTNATPASGTQPTQEEIDEQVRLAQEHAASQPAPVCEPEPGTPDPARTPAPEPTTTPDREAPTTRGQAAPRVDGNTPIAAVPSSGDHLADMAELRGGALREWDNEVAWHDHFQGGGAAGGAGGGPQQGIQVDRDALILDALAGGGLAGFKDGAWNLLVDTGINMASSKIPYLSGFVEMARIAYDPQAWFEGQSQATFGKAARGLDQLLNGDWVTKIEGLVNLLDGVANTVGLLSTICWIVAAGGFIVSLFCPAALPFVALAAQWGLTLGSIGTLLGIYVTLARLMVMGLRAAQIKFEEADPQTLLERGEMLRAQTQSFASETTARAGASLRGRAQRHLDGQRQQRADQAAGRPSQPQPTVDPPSRMSRIAGILSGAWGSEGAAGSGFRQQHADAGDGLGQARRVTQAYRGTGEYAGGGERGTRQTLNDMEHAGATVYNSDAHRERVDGQLNARGDRSATNRNAEADLAALTQKRDAANRDLEEATDARRRTAEEVERRTAALEEANAELARIRARDGHAIDAQRNEVNERRGLVVAYERDRDAARAHLQSLEDVRRVAMEHRDSAPDNRAQYDGIVRETDGQIAQARSRLDTMEQNVRDARTFLADGETQLRAASADVDRARGDVEQRWGARDEARAQLARDEQRRVEANATANTHKEAVNTYEPPPGGLSHEEAERRSRAAANYRWYTDYGAEGPTALHGHNKAKDVLGAGTSIPSDVSQGMDRQDEAAAAGQERPGGPMGTWSRTLSGQDVDFRGQAPGRGDGAEEQDYVHQLRHAYDRLRTSLPAPPRDAPGQVDGTAAAYERLDQEDRQIQLQQQTMGQLAQEGQQEMSALTVMQEVVRANEEATRRHQAELAEKRRAQGQLAAQAEENRANAQQGVERGSEGQGRTGPFVNRFLELMGMVPTRLVPNAGAGAAGARQLGQGVQRQGDSSREMVTGADALRTGANDMMQGTDTATAEATAAGQQLQGVGAGLSERELSAQDGLAFIQETMQRSEARREQLAAEKDRLRAGHDGATTRMAEWMNTHAGKRQEGMGELDGIVQLVQGGGR